MNINIRFILVFFTVFMVACSNDDFSSETETSQNEKLLGTWIRHGQDSTWTVYSYRNNNELYRATNNELNMRRFGSYELKGDTMIFVNSPENYTPVIYRIESKTNEGILQDTLYLSDAETLTPYGFYTRITNETLKRDYGVNVL